MEAFIDVTLIFDNKKQVVSEDHIQEFVELLAGGKRFPPIVVRYDGTGYRIVDGRHRLEAHKRLGRSLVRARISL